MISPIPLLSMNLFTYPTISTNLGLLSEVSHASVTQINSTVLSLQYTAPYTLSGVPISHYNILTLPTNASVNITDTQYNIHINDYCISYNISITVITPWNIVGAGNISTLSDIILYQGIVETCIILCLGFFHSS